MKKVLIGCGVFILIVIVLAGVLGYQFYQMGKTMIKGMDEAQKQYQQVEAKFSFTAPADGIVTAEQMEKWLAVRKDVLTASPELKGADEKGPGGNPFTALNKVFGMITTVAHAHAGALNEHSMSLSEYSWISRNVLGTLNSGDSRQDPKFKELIGQIDAMQHENPRNKQQTIPIWANAAPLTSQQIVKMTPIVEAKVQELTETRRMFVVDAFVIQQTPMLTHKGNRQTTGTTQVEETAQTTTQQTTGTTPSMTPAPAQ